MHNTLLKIPRQLVLGMVLTLVGFTAFAIDPGKPVEPYNTTSIVDFQVTGHLTDENGSAMPGVNILEKGTTNGTTSDANGDYAIKLQDSNSVLVFSFIGYAQQEVSVSGQTVINVSLVADMKTLSEIVVVGYGTQQRKDLTGSISSVSSDQIEKVPVTTIDKALQGRSAGVQVTTDDGSPGASISVRIRGIGSLGNNSPLYVVDGYPISGGINTLNPNDIASIDVLKDASATAIYGSRASNGVVIITTKRGKKDGIQISFDSYVSSQSTPKLVKVANAQEFAEMAVAVDERDNLGMALPEWKTNTGALRNIDWQKELYGTGKTQSYNLAIRGGGEKTQASFSVGYYSQKGIVKFSDFKRFNASLNLDYQPTKWLNSGTNIKYTRTDGQVRFGSGVGGLEMLTKLIPTLTGNPLTDQVKDENGNYGYYPIGSTATGSSTNILANLEDQDRAGATNRVNASTYLELSLLPGLKFKTNAGLNFDEGSSFWFQKSNNRQTAPTPTSYSQNSNNTFEWLWENTLAYSKTFGIHAIDVVGGISAQENTYRTLGISGNGLVNDGLRDVGSLDNITGRYGNQQGWSLYSQFGRLTYKLKDGRYIVTGTVRRDGSSKFPSYNRFGVFPSVSAAWRIKDENFMTAIDAISDLKIRGSWGQTGNQFIDPYKYQGPYWTGPSSTDNRGYVFGPYANKQYYTGIVLKGLPVPDLKWETTTQTDIGIDAGFLNGKVNFTVDYYNKKAVNALATISVPSQTGFDAATRNIGSIQNSGFEFSANYRVSSGPVQWSVGANLTTIKNKIISLTDGLTSLPNVTNLNFQTFSATDSWGIFSRSEVGGNVGAFYGFVSDGIFQTQGEIDDLNAKAGDGAFYQTTKTVPGDRKFKDLDSDGRITDKDRKIIGSPIPKFYAGFNADASYKNFDISMLWYASVGNEILNYSKRNLESMAANGGGLQNVSEDYYKNHWTEANHSNTYTRPIFTDVNGSTRVSDYYVEDGSYLRLRNVQLGYTLPGTLASKIRLSRLRLYVSSQNLLTITKYSGLNPEIGDNSNGSVQSVTTSGLDIGSYPVTRSFTFGLSAQF